VRFLASIGVLFALTSLGPNVRAQEPERVIEVIELEGPLEARVLDFAADTIEAAAGVEVVVLQIDSPGVVDGEEELQRLLGLLADPPVPVVAWVGPAPAVAYGGALQIYAAAPVKAAAPGAEMGYGAPTIIGRVNDPVVPLPEDLVDGTTRVEATAPLGGLVQPSLRQLVVSDLDGQEVQTRSGTRILSTLQPIDGGVTHIPTVLRQPGLWDRFLRLAVRPEAAFFFLAAGLTVAAFEFYAIGPGIAAGVAAISLFLGGYGLSVLPVRGWALGLLLASWGLLVASHQRGGIGVLRVVGTLGVGVAGWFFADTAPQIVPSPLGVALTAVAVGAFFWVAMPTVTRARFSTGTVGRESLMGRRGQALVRFDPDGVVEVEGARWPATAHRAAGIEPGTPVVVTGLDGHYLEVEPVRENRP
jgi:membrane-bound ClpP family serine protease